MRLTVKVLNGAECSLAAAPSSSVSDVKTQVQALMSIPVSDQKLLYKGKALMDAKLLKDYGVDDGSKITLVVKKSLGNTNTKEPVAPSEPERPVWESVRKFLRRHFTEKDAELVLQEFKKEFFVNLESLSLDDIERFAATKLRQA